MRGKTDDFEYDEEEMGGVRKSILGEGMTRKINKFTIIATLIIWIVNRPTRGNVQMQKAAEYIKATKGKKLNEAEKTVLKQSNCEYEQRTQHIVFMKCFDGEHY